VIMDGAAIRSCRTRVRNAAGRKIVTIEGIGSETAPHPLQKAFIAEQAMQCGYCSNGMIMAAKALLDRNRHPADSEIRSALAGNLCRCGSHTRILRAVARAAKEMAS
jgi:nicotinate dehydrogenase subunit A